MMAKLLSDKELVAEIDVITDNLLANGVAAKSVYDAQIYKLVRDQKEALVLTHNYHGGVDTLGLSNGTFYQAWVRVIGNKNGWWGEIRDNYEAAKRDLTQELMIVAQ